MSTRHKPELDGIRGMAILGVLATHSAFYIQATSATKPLMALMLSGQWGVDPSLERQVQTQICGSGRGVRACSIKQTSCNILKPQ